MLFRAMPMLGGATSQSYITPPKVLMIQKGLTSGYNYPWGIYDGITMLGNSFQLYLEATNQLDFSSITVP